MDKDPFIAQEYSPWSMQDMMFASSTEWEHQAWNLHKVICHATTVFGRCHPEELIELATNMLSGMVGETMAQKYLEQILNKYHLNP